jgi:hypothetical protein
MKLEPKKNPMSPRPIQPIETPISQGKIVLAVVLIGVMGFLWIRVFVRHGKPATAAARPAATQAATPAKGPQKAPAIRLSYVPLQVVPGRQDVLTRDLFAEPDSAVFPWQKSQIPTEPSKEESVNVDPWDKEIRPLAEKLSVDAIGTDPKGTAQAFIQDRFLVAGDRLPIQKGDRTYELTVTLIQSNSVTLEWQGHELKLKMSEPGMTGNK